MSDKTIRFPVVSGSEDERKQMLREVFHALSEKGFDPVNQIVGYLLTEDPSYITSHNGARAKILQFDRDELMQELVKAYLFD